eukprot:GHVP01032509.1.p1 GENE.GHVP01032509.1~~GHVP01032509.1.p1  ORF type:complete len:132 (+),score=10.66 GHVP01032509.1:3-398(+)
MSPLKSLLSLKVPNALDSIEKSLLWMKDMLSEGAMVNGPEPVRNTDGIFSLKTVIGDLAASRTRKIINEETLVPVPCLSPTNSPSPTRILPEGRTSIGQMYITSSRRSSISASDGFDLQKLTKKFRLGLRR